MNQRNSKYASSRDSKREIKILEFLLERSKPAESGSNFCVSFGPLASKYPADVRLRNALRREKILIYRGPLRKLDRSAKLACVASFGTTAISTSIIAYEVAVDEVRRLLKVRQEVHQNAQPPPLMKVATKQQKAVVKFLESLVSRKQCWRDGNHYVVDVYAERERFSHVEHIVALCKRHEVLTYHDRASNLPTDLIQALLPKRLALPILGCKRVWLLNLGSLATLRAKMLQGSVSLYRS